MFSSLSTTLAEMAVAEEEAGGGALAALFSQGAKKPAPKYDYSAIPKRKRESEGEDEDEEEEVTGKKKKKPKSGKRGLRKRAEAEAAGKEGGGKAEGAETQDELFKAAKEAKQKEAMEVQRHDRMAQVKHEDSKEQVQRDPEKEARTIYVGNIPVKLQKNQLKQMFAKFGAVEAVRLRCAARPDMKTTKKVAVIKQKFHDERSSIAAFVRFVERSSAEAATALNGEEVEGHVLRVDLALAAKSHDHRRAVFLGNLDFKVQEDEVRAVFSKCGEVESVRLVRDSSTGIGKGFGYVNFVAAEAVELALRLVNQLVGGRKVRVTRAVRKVKAGKVMVPKAAKKGGKAGKAAGKAEVKGKKSKSSSRSQGHDKRSVNFRKLKDEAKAFQGVSTTTDKPKKKKLNKTEKKNKIVAQKLAA